MISAVAVFIDGQRLTQWFVFHGDGWEMLREGIGGDAGWALYLQRYADLFPERTAS